MNQETKSIETLQIAPDLLQTAVNDLGFRRIMHGRSRQAPVACEKLGLFPTNFK